MYLFETNPAINNKRSKSHLQHLDNDDRVLWYSKLEKLTRTKRDFIPLNELMKTNRTKRNLYQIDDDFINYELNSPIIFDKNLFNDELWDQEWYLHENIPYSDGRRTLETKMSLNVLPVYKRGITGQGIRVAVIDDGLEYTHDDLYENYDPEISWDCTNDHPNPCPDFSNKLNNHGTRCAGEIAMIANNLKCGVGVAFNVNIGGIKLLGGYVYDFMEGVALGFRHDKIDIYSSSWGPRDNGVVLEEPKYLAKKSLKRGITYGRNGLGSIYVWATGNGRGNDDNCACDGYVSSIYTIAIGSVTQHGTLPWYSEICSATLAVTYSSGSLDEQMITTTDFGNSCTMKHTGTSASAPLAAGIIALGLQAK